MTAEPVPAGRTDRAATARLLTEIAFDLFDGQAIAGGAPIRLGCQMEPVGNMTDEQSEFLRTRLGDCRPGLVTTATNRVTWTDSAGISNVAYAGALGAVVPVVAREATLALWARLSAEQRLADRTASLSDTERALLADVTTDKEPLEILRTGIDAAARVLVQHAYLAALTPYDDAAAFAVVLRDSGIFTTVAGTWHWGLQASTYRRGLIPVQLIAFGGRVTYSADTVAGLRAMKEARIATARELAEHARSTGTALAHAVDHDVHADPSALLYGALDDSEQPRCLAHAPQVVDGRRVSMVSLVADLFVDTFVRLLDVVELTPTRFESESAMSTTTFEVPDMTCQHCINTITKAVAELGVEPPEFDLETKRVVAGFASAAIRDDSFAAIRAHGYTVVPLPA